MPETSPNGAVHKRSFISERRIGSRGCNRAIFISGLVCPMPRQPGSLPSGTQFDLISFGGNRASDPIIWPQRSVGLRMLDVIYDQEFHYAFRRFQLEPELLLQRDEH